MHRLGFLSLPNPYLSLYFHYLAARKGERKQLAVITVSLPEAPLSLTSSVGVDLFFSVSATYDFSCSNPEISTGQTIS